MNVVNDITVNNLLLATHGLYFCVITTKVKLMTNGLK